MRVTSSMLVSNFMNNLNTNLTRMSALQDQMASGKTFAHISDDPVALIYSQQAKYKLTILADYEANVESSRKWLTQAEAGTMELNQVLVFAYESCLDAATDVKTGGDRANIAPYVKQLRDQILQTLNSTLGDKYVYGGYNTTGYTENGLSVPPFTVNGAGNLCYNGVDLTDDDPATLALVEQLRSDALSFDVAIGTNLTSTVSGIDVVFYGKGENGENLNIYNLLDDMYNTLVSGTSGADDLTPYISDLQMAQNHTLAITADIGGRTKRLDILSSRYTQDTLNYTQMLSDAEDADLAEVIMKYKMAESVYNASLSAGAYIIQPTLMDFLK